MIPVEEALSRVFALAPRMAAESLPLSRAAGRVLAAPLAASHDQPPFAASAMDGYALAGPVSPGQSLRVTGEAGAGHVHDRPLAPGEALRIFTGAPLPRGADRVVIQEDTDREGERITLRASPEAGANIRPAGGDFRAGAEITAPRRLRPVDLALIAAMGHARVPVAHRPVVALIPTGDELVMPGEARGPGQIAASSVFALQAMAEAEGAETRLLPIARDDDAHLRAIFALAEGADVIVTTGGASVGDHDLVGPVAQALGAELALWKIAMRPGKPLMAGRLGGALFLGLPGNPVSSLVCAQLFLLPVLRAMQGLPAAPAPAQIARLSEPVARNGPREHYMRATLEPGGRIRAVPRQDSSLLTVLAKADALLIRPVDDPERPVGHEVRYIPL